MHHAVFGRQIILGAQHFRQRPRGAQLRFGDNRLVRLHSRFERHAQEAVIQVQIQPFGISPNGVTGVIGRIRFDYDAVHPSETIDHEVIRTMVPHIQQQFLADSF